MVNDPTYNNIKLQMFCSISNNYNIFWCISDKNKMFL